MGRQGNVWLLGFGLKIGHKSAVQQVEDGLVHLVVAHLIEQVDEGRVRLSVNVFELNGNRIRVLKCLTTKEIHRLVMVAQEVPLLVFDNGRQLVQVADHQQLQSSEGLPAVAITAQNIVNGIKHIGSDHTDFVDDEQVEALNQSDFFTGKFALTVGIRCCAGQKRAKRQLKKRVDGHAPCIDGGYPGGGHDDHSFEAFPFNLVEKRGFPGPGFTCKKDVFVRIPHVIESEVELRIRLDGHILFSWGLWLENVMTKRNYNKAPRNANIRNAGRWTLDC